MATLYAINILIPLAVALSVAGSLSKIFVLNIAGMAILAAAIGVVIAMVVYAFKLTPKPQPRPEAKQ
jgi:hypothetical protein